MPDDSRIYQDWEPDIYGDPDRPLRTTHRAFDALLGHLNAIADAQARAAAAGREADLHATPASSGFLLENHRSYVKWLEDRADSEEAETAA